MHDIAVRDYGIPTYFIDRDHFAVTDPILPSQIFFSDSENGLLVEAAQSPLTWAAMDRSQLCFRDGPIENTGMIRFPGIWGQVLLDYGVGGTPTEVRTSFVGDYVNDALHRAYSHSSDFLIESFESPQTAHDNDADAIKMEFAFLQKAKAQGLIDDDLPVRVTADYPDINLDRFEFGLRQMYGMGWLPMEKWNTSVGLDRLLEINADGVLAFKNEEFGIYFSMAFSYLGSENWLSPLQRAALLVQQAELKNRTSGEHFHSPASIIALSKGLADYAHPYDSLYDCEFWTDSEHFRVDGDQTSRDIDFVTKSLVGAARSRNRVDNIRKHLDGVVKGDKSAMSFVNPLENIGEGEAIPFGVSIIETDDEGESTIFYDRQASGLVFTLPGSMKPRVLNPMHSSGGRLSDSVDGLYAGFMEQFEAFTTTSHRLILHGASNQFADRFLGELDEINANYAAALERPKLSPQDLALLVEYVGRLSMKIALEERGVGVGGYRFQVILSDGVIRDNDIAFEKVRDAIYE